METNVNKECCEKCICKHNENDYDGPTHCTRHFSGCECHSPKSEAQGESWEEQYDRLFAGGGAPDITSAIKSFISKKLEEARERGYIEGQNDKENNEKFLRRGRLAAYQEVRSVVEGMKEEVTDCMHTPSDSCDQLCSEQSSRISHNAALTDILSHIDSLITR